MERRIFTWPNIIFTILSLFAISLGDSGFLFLLIIYALMVTFMYVLSNKNFEKILYNFQVIFQMIFWFAMFSFIAMGPVVFIALGPIIFIIALFLFFKG